MSGHLPPVTGERGETMNDLDSPMFRPRDIISYMGKILAVQDAPQLATVEKDHLDSSRASQGLPFKQYSFSSVH
jgi:hypothetical protein